MIKDLRIGAEAVCGNELDHVLRLIYVTSPMLARRLADTPTATIVRFLRSARRPSAVTWHEDAIRGPKRECEELLAESHRQDAQADALLVGRTSRAGITRCDPVNAVRG